MSFLCFSWIAFICGCSICRPRWALICLTNSGISAIRMSTTRPTIDRPHAAPLSAGKTMLNSEWNRSSTQETASYSGLSRPMAGA